MSVGERVTALRSLLAADGVHLTPDGYKNFAKNLCSVINDRTSGKLGKPKTSTNARLVSGSNFHWRGFNSPVGSYKKSLSFKMARERVRPSCPYGKGKGGGQICLEKLDWRL